jgi:hypothetical protein
MLAKESLRTTVSVPDEVRDLVEWFVKYEPRFEHNLARVLAELVRVGAKQLYAKGIEESTPLEEEVVGLLRAYSSNALKVPNKE